MLSSSRRVCEAVHLGVQEADFLPADQNPLQLGRLFQGQGRPNTHVYSTTTGLTKMASHYVCLCWYHNFPLLGRPHLRVSAHSLLGSGLNYCQIIKRIANS